MTILGLNGPHLLSSVTTAGGGEWRRSLCPLPSLPERIAVAAHSKAFNSAVTVIFIY